MRRRNGIGWIFIVLLVAGLAYAALAPPQAPRGERPVSPVLTPPPMERSRAETERFLAWTPRDPPRAPRNGPPPSGAPALRLEAVIWVAPGIVLREQPSDDAPALDTIQAIAKAPFDERRGDFFHIRHQGKEGWVHLPGYDQGDPAAPPLGTAPDKLAPLLARDPDPALLGRARALLGERERAGRLGPFELFTDLPAAALDLRLDGVSRAVELAYQARYGRYPVGEAKGAIVLFAGEGAYRIFELQSENLRRGTAAGHNNLGVVALYAGGRHPDEVGATLVHELAHLLNRRALGPALPAWLDEGLCEDLAFSRIGAGGELLAGEIGGRSTRREGFDEFSGTLSSFFRLREALLAHRLPYLSELEASDWRGLENAETRRISYDLAGAWVRFLLDGEAGRRAPGFRKFLASVADGGPPDSAGLFAALGETSETAEAGFRVWLLAESNRLLGPP